MSDDLRIQIKVAAAPEKVYHALTDAAALRGWFAEHAEVSDKNYGFWGRFTLEAPDQAKGQHPILANVPNQQLKYGWRIGDIETTVQFDLTAQDGHTLALMTQHSDGEWSTYLTEDFWFLSLENLRRYVEGKPSDLRIDFTAPKTGDIRLSIDINAPANEIYQALLKPEQLERWIASKATVEPVVGGKYDFGWGSPPMKILSLKENESLAVTEPDSGMVVTWTLEESGGKTRLTIVHSGFAADADNSGLQYGWRNFLNWIRALVEEGAAWQPPLKELREDQFPFYAEVIGRHQHQLTFKQ